MIKLFRYNVVGIQGTRSQCRPRPQNINGFCDVVRIWTLLYWVLNGNPCTFQSDFNCISFIVLEFYWWKAKVWRTFLKRNFLQLLLNCIFLGETVCPIQLLCLLRNVSDLVTHQKIMLYPQLCFKLTEFYILQSYHASLSKSLN